LRNFPYRAARVGQGPYGRWCTATAPETVNTIHHIYFKNTSSRLIAMGLFLSVTIKTLTCFRFSDLWPEIQATRYAGGR
jgi:hypothetical protein